jgi:predicted ArsR family transcriptional regulator
VGVDRSPDLEQRISGIAALDQPLRRDLYRLLSERGGWVGRDEAADALGVARSVAAFHLDKLAEAGVVDVRFERPPGRSGPGAGRPAKLYRRAQVELSASVPDRHYELAGSLLATGVAESIRTGQPVGESLSTVAHTAGRRIGEEARGARGDGTSDEQPIEAVCDVLARLGYEPKTDHPGEIALANCPFHRLAEEQRPLVCGMNLEFVDGMIEGLGATTRLEVRLAPEPGWCCVRLTAS